MPEKRTQMLAFRTGGIDHNLRLTRDVRPTFDRIGSHGFVVPPLVGDIHGIVFIIPTSRFIILREVHQVVSRLRGGQLFIALFRTRLKACKCCL